MKSRSYLHPCGRRRILLKEAELAGVHGLLTGEAERVEMKSYRFRGARGPCLDRWWLVDSGQPDASGHAFGSLAGAARRSPEMPSARAHAGTAPVRAAAQLTQRGKIRSV